MSDSALYSRAIAILKANDRGGYTVPTARLYPYQWNWDSAFCALGFATFDTARAWQEIETLFEAQWPDGMVPHIIFRRDDPDYFPGPSVWQSNTTPPSSGYSQPPVVASIVQKLLQIDNDNEQRARLLFPKILNWHRWYHQARDPENIGLIATAHPWETGRDNCPDWDQPMANIKIAELDPYQRRDIHHVDQSQRPSKDEYDRYLTLIKFGRECAWDSKEIAENNPFWVADPGITFILLRADRDLLSLAQRFGEDTAVVEIRNWIKQSERGIDRLWNEKVGSFCSLDLRTGEHGDGISSAAMLAFYAHAGTPTQQTRQLAQINRICNKANFAMPSWDPEHKDFDSVRYWRGPVWAMMNFMIAQGLLESGHAALAERVRVDSANLIASNGFHEYYCPITGQGCGGNDFSWTAAIALWWNLLSNLPSSDTC